MIGSTVLKRAVEVAIDTSQAVPENTREFYSWAWIIFVVDVILFIPAIVLINYTFEQVLPIFAIVEDEHPPAYEPVPLDNEAAVPGAPVNKTASAAVPTRPLNLTTDDDKPITSSFMSTWRLLRSHGGFRSIFRGFACFAFYSAINNWVSFIFHGLLGPLFFVAPLITSLLLVQFSTAWVHIVLTPATSQHFWRRLPAFKSTLAATWRPVAIVWAVNAASRGLNYLALSAFGLDIDQTPNFDMPVDVSAWKFMLVFLAVILIRVFIYVPAFVALVRVQASLLPDDQETIIPFDRTFQGKVEPAIVGGTGYVSLRDAWATFSAAAWRRLIILYVKIMAIGAAFGFVIAAVMVPQFFLLSRPIDSGNQ